MTQLEMPITRDVGALGRAKTERAGNRYLASVSKSERLAHGRVYTPPHLVQFVLDLAGYETDRDLARLRVLDPACGGGAFLTEAALRIAERLRASGVRLHTTRGARRFLRNCERTLYGVDIDPAACQLSRRAIREVASKVVAPQPVDASFFADNIRERDFLLADDVDTIGPKGGFDLIVGNPPYVPTTRLTAGAKETYRSRFRTANGRIDLYVLFFERALSRVREGGRLAFITPNKFLTSVSAGPLRELLRDSTSVRTIAEFDSHKVFQDAATVPCVTVVDQGQAGAPGDTTYLRCVASPSAIKIAHESQHELPKQEWRLGAPSVLNLLEQLRGTHPPLSGYVTRISAGIATGRDRVFVLSTEEADELGIEEELRRPVVRGKDTREGSISTSGLEIVIPYLRATEGEKPELIEIENYPATLAYLGQHRRELERRHCVRTWGKRWYDLHDPWSFDVAGAAKIVVPDVAFSNRFAADPGGLCPLHSAYYIVPRNVDEMPYLTAILNSEVIEFCVRASAPTVKDGFVRYRKQFLQHLPIPHLDARQRAALIRAQSHPKRWERALLRYFGVTESALEEMRLFIRKSRENHNQPPRESP